MTSTLTGDTLAGLVAEFAQLVDRLQQVDLIPASDDDLVGFWRSVEVQTRRLASVDHRVIASVEQRGLPGTTCLRLHRGAGARCADCGAG